jgi:small-conductance mechanosensitive channel
MEPILKTLRDVRDFLDIPLFRLGDTHVTLWAILYLLILLVLLFYLTGRLKYFIVARVLAKSSIEVGVRQAVGSIIRYGVVAVGVVVIFETAGIDLSALTILAGALGIGVGFGLQNITNNLVSGLIILLERPIKVGDRIEVGKVVGDVLKISLRATTVRTNDNIAIIIPNSDFVSSSVTNWSYTDRDVRFNIPVGVSYNSDPEAVKRILLEVADEHSGVLKTPEPDVIFEEFGESSLNFLLRVWTREYITRPYILRSELNFAIKKKFKEQGIEIPFPQRDLHIRSGAIQLKPSS